ncbi:MAG: ATP-binding protein [Terriglobales bacterium]
MTTAETQEATIDILDQKSDGSLRQGICNVIDSYHHDWDVLAELCQNAVDAIREKNPPKGAISVLFDRGKRSIEVKDTGIGMTRSQVEKALAPNMTFKKGNLKLVGEKGLGLTFCAFRANRILIETSRGDGAIHTVVFEHGRDWVEEKAPERPLVLASSRNETSGAFTRVLAEDVLADFALEEQRLKHLLLTKTALGCTFPLWSETEKRAAQIDISLLIVEPDGAEKSAQIPHRFWHPADNLKHTKTLAEVRELAKNNKMRDFKGWGLTDKRQVILSNNKVAYFYTMMLSVPEYDEIAEKGGLLSRYKLREKEAERSGTEVTRSDEPGDVEPGIYLSVRGMPTGISLPFPTGTTEAGYWNNFYFLVEAEWLTFDSGRKVVPGRTQEIIKRACKGIWDELRAWKGNFIGAEGEEVDQFAEEQKYQKRIQAVEAFPPLQLGKVPFAKEPQNEQATIALFYEILGRGLLKGYQTFDINTASTYDAVVRYSLAGSEVGSQALQMWRQKLNKKTAQSIEFFPLNVEYKWEASAILDDLSDKTKYLEQIHLLVCWTCDDQRFEKSGVGVYLVDRDAELFNGASKRLEFGSSFSSQRTVYVIELKQIVKRLEKEG